MAFAESGLTSLAFGVGVNKFWHYSSNDDYAMVGASGYFNNATAKLKKGDFIFASLDLDGTEAAAVLMVSSETDAATVTTVAITNT